MLAGEGSKYAAASDLTVLSVKNSKTDKLYRAAVIEGCRSGRQSGSQSVTQDVCLFVRVIVLLLLYIIFL